MDSLQKKHMSVYTALATFLRREAEERKDIKVNTDRMLNVTGRVPAQPNFCDCGIYVLHYVESLLKDPDHYLFLLIVRTLLCAEWV
jgi:Ulp1 family protease